MQVEEKNTWLCCFQVHCHSNDPKVYSMQWFFGASEKGLRRNGLRFLFAITHVVKETITSCKQQQGIQKRPHGWRRCSKLLAGIGFVCSIVIFNICCLHNCKRLSHFIIVVMQDMDLVSWAQLFRGKVIKASVNDHVVKLVGNLESEIETTSSTIVDGDGQLNFAGRRDCNYINNTNKLFN